MIITHTVTTIILLKIFLFSHEIISEKKLFPTKLLRYFSYLIALFDALEELPIFLIYFRLKN